MKIKRYWIQNTKTLQEYVLDARLEEIPQRTGWDPKNIRIYQDFLDLLRKSKKEAK